MTEMGFTTELSSCARLVTCGVPLPQYLLAHHFPHPGIARLHPPGCSPPQALSPTAAGMHHQRAPMRRSNSGGGPNHGMFASVHAGGGGGGGGDPSLIDGAMVDGPENFYGSDPAIARHLRRLGPYYDDLASPGLAPSPGVVGYEDYGPAPPPPPPRPLRYEGPLSPTSAYHHHQQQQAELMAWEEQRHHRGPPPRHLRSRSVSPRRKSSGRGSRNPRVGGTHDVKNCSTNHRLPCSSLL